jgi:hypothetical protein
MSTIINGTSSAITFPDSSVQNTSAIVSGYVPYANLPAGSVLQVVQTSAENLFQNTSSTTFVATSLAATITPKFSTSKILVITSFTIDTNASGTTGITTLYRNSTNLNSVKGMTQLYTTARIQAFCGFDYMDSPATTSATTYTVYIRTGGSGSIDFCADNNRASIILMEIAG